MILIKLRISAIKLLTTILLLVSVTITRGQNETSELFSIKLSNPEVSGKLIVEQITGSINVIAYGGKEISVKAILPDENDGNGNMLSTNGLKKIENSVLEIYAEEKDNVVEIINKLHSRPTNLEIKVPRNFSLKLRTVNKGVITVEDVNGELEVSNVNGKIFLTNVSGSVSVDTVSGDIKVVFNTISTGANMAFSSLNGNIDVTFPTTLKANIKAKSDNGEISTDFDIKLKKQELVVDRQKTPNAYKARIEGWIYGEINNGGPELLFKNINGDIIIRSK